MMPCMSMKSPQLSIMTIIIMFTCVSKFFFSFEGGGGGGGEQRQGENNVSSPRKLALPPERKKLFGATLILILLSEKTIDVCMILSYCVVFLCHIQQ